MQTPPKLACLLLAAGGASRFGGQKQLAPIEGQPMIRHTLAQLMPIFGDHLFVVLGAYRQAVEPEITGQCRIIDHEQWQAGMGTSIAQGVSKIIRHDHYHGIMIALADQVAISRDDYQRLVNHYEAERITAACYANRLAAPALFPRRYFDRLQQLQGDTGARRLLREHPASVIGVDLPAAAVDIDTPADLKAFRATGYDSRQSAL